MAPQLISLPVGRGTALMQEVPVSKGGIVRWSLLVADGYDIALSIYLAPTSGERLEIQPPVRLTTDAGSTCATADGMLQLVLDNSFSLLRSKTVNLRIAHGAATLTLAAARDDMIFDPETASALAMGGIDIFFQNRFGEAEAYFSTFADTVPVFALSLAAVAFLRAIMTWEPAELANAQEKLKAAQKLCEGHMPQGGSWTGFFRGGGGAVTPAQLDAIVISGEATLLAGLLYLTEESLMGVVRFAMAVRTGWKYFAQADRLAGQAVTKITDGPAFVPPAILPAAVNPDTSPPASPAPDAAVPGSAGFHGQPPAATAVLCSFSTAPEDVYALEPCAGFPRMNRHIMGGILFGVGTFNCVSSVLPPIAVRVIAALGFPCDRDAGMEQLRQCLRSWGVRSPLAGMFLLLMRVLFPSFSSSDISDHVPEAEAVLSSILGRYEGSALFLWMAGRLARMEGNVTLARSRLLRCAGVEWRQFAQLCDYEVGWSYAFMLDWAAVRSLFVRLRGENEWSKAFYAYMEACALLQLGRLAQARAAMKRVIRLAGRRLGGKLISAEQYAVRRAAEFVALTVVDAADGAAASAAAGATGGGSGSDDVDAAELPDEAVLPASQVAPGALKSLRLPAVVAVGSAAHAAVLGYAAPMAGLEAVYLFNGATQMDAVACRCAIAQVDAVLAAVAAGAVFNAAAPVWSGTAAAAAGGAAEEEPRLWEDQHRHATAGADAGAVAGALSKSPAEVVALLQAAAAAPNLVGAGSPPLSSQQQLPAAGAASLGVGAASPTPKAKPRGGFMSSIASALKGSGGAGSTTAAAAAEPVPLLPANTVPTPLQPAHTAALGGLIRGALCSRIGRIDEAAACFRWVIAAAAPGGGGASSALFGAGLRRDLHVYAYACYELGVLFADGVKVMARRDAAAAAAAAAAGGASSGAALAAAAPALSAAAAHSHGGADLLASELLRGLSVRDAKRAAKEQLRAASAVRDDFNWKLRLHLRVHLTGDDLRASLGAKSTRRVLGGAAAGAAAAGGGGGAPGDAPEDTSRMEAMLLASAERPIGADDAAGDELADDD